MLLYLSCFYAFLAVLIYFVKRLIYYPCTIPQDNLSVMKPCIPSSNHLLPQIGILTHGKVIGLARLGCNSDRGNLHGHSWNPPLARAHAWACLLTIHAKEPETNLMQYLYYSLFLGLCMDDGFSMRALPQTILLCWPFHTNLGVIVTTHF